LPDFFHSSFDWRLYAAVQFKETLSLLSAMVYLTGVWRTLNWGRRFFPDEIWMLWQTVAVRWIG
jgi:hypothetical protein